MTRSYSDSIALAAREIVQSSGVDITATVPVLPLAKRLMQETGCGIDAAKRHIAKAIRLARGESINPPTWGGHRTPAGGRPKTMNTGRRPVDAANQKQAERIATIETRCNRLAVAFYADDDNVRVVDFVRLQSDERMVSFIVRAWPTPGERNWHQDEIDIYGVAGETTTWL